MVARQQQQQQHQLDQEDDDEHWLIEVWLLCRRLLPYCFSFYSHPVYFRFSLLLARFLVFFVLAAAAVHAAADVGIVVAG